jgi:FtsZ-interacting cell division protein ZipA
VYALIPLDLLPGISDTLLIIIVIAIAAVAIIGSFFIMSRRRRAVPSRAAPAPTPVRVEKPAAAPVEKVDEDVVRLKVEKTATESALKSLEAAVKEGAITKETFEKHKATYSERLRKIDSELSKRTKVSTTKLENEIERVRNSYLDKLKDLSKKAITSKPAVAVPKTAAAPLAAPIAKTSVPTQVPVRPEPTLKVPEIPTRRMEEAFGEEEPAPAVPRIPTPAAPTERPLSAAVKPAPSGPATISDLRREMMDELNRLKRLIGRAEA